MSVYSLLFAVMLFSEMNSRLVTAAMPSTTVEGGASEQEGLDSILAEEDMPEHAMAPLMHRWSLMSDGTYKFVIIPDMNLEGRSIVGLKSGLLRSYPPIKERSLDRTPDELTFKINKREKDLDVLRCMIGRVYRPCWE